MKDSNFSFKNILKFKKKRIDKSAYGKEYLFIGGCARSGTTVLTTIIGSHQKIILGMERYSWLYQPRSFKICPDHFKKDRFIDVRDGDTHYEDFNKFSVHHNIEEKWENAKYIGDKNPIIDEQLINVYSALGKLKLIFIYRDIFEVAESWNKRAENDVTWDKNLDFRESVKRWNASLINLISYIEQGHDVICLNYNDLLFSNKPINIIFSWLGLKPDDSVIKELNMAREKAIAIKERKGKLSSNAIKYIYVDAIS